jgi:hypothetical protein
VKVLSIPPGPLAEKLIPVGHKMHLVVTDAFLASESYRTFYLKRSMAGDKMIVDSGAFEGLIPKPEDMLNVAMQINAMEVALPDQFKDAAKTAEMAEAGFKYLNQHGYEGQYMAVPQGRTFHEYLWCAETLAQVDRSVRTFGVIEEIEELYSVPRHIVVAALKEMFPQHNIHLLGISEDLDEMNNPVMLEYARSCDTAKLIVWGLNGMRLFPERGMSSLPQYPGRQTLGGRMPYFHYEAASEEAIAAVRWNISQVQGYLWRKQEELNGV